MKRGREGDLDHTLTIKVDYFMLFSSGGGSGNFHSPDAQSSRIFECKTCNRKFPSFQALGGHRASHKRTRLLGGDLNHQSPEKLKVHECSICGVEFALGQALGGHMRRHRVAASGNGTAELSLSPTQVTAVEKLNSNRRVLWLDLNLSPGEELDFQIKKKVAPPRADPDNYVRRGQIIKICVK